MALRVTKLVTQKELKLQADMIKSLIKQGWFAAKTTDRFKAGRPDLRIGHDDYGQLDVELKYNDWPMESLEEALEIDTTMRKIQWLKVREMNQHGMPAICLMFWEALNAFSVTTLLRVPLPPPERRVLKLPGSEVIRGSVLFVDSMEHLHDLGYHTKTRN